MLLVLQVVSCDQEYQRLLKMSMKIVHEDVHEEVHEDCSNFITFMFKCSFRTFPLFLIEHAECYDFYEILLKVLIIYFPYISLFGYTKVFQKPLIS